ARRCRARSRPSCPPPRAAARGARRASPGPPARGRAPRRASAAAPRPACGGRPRSARCSVEPFSGRARAVLGRCRRRAREAPEAALAPPELGERGGEVGRLEVGPRALGEVELGVRALPEEEVGEALLAARADQQI